MGFVYMVGFTLDVDFDNKSSYLFRVQLIAMGIHSHIMPTESAFGEWEPTLSWTSLCNLINYQETKKSSRCVTP